MKDNGSKIIYYFDGIYRIYDENSNCNDTNKNIFIISIMYVVFKIIIPGMLNLIMIFASNTGNKFPNYKYELFDIYSHRNGNIL